jgi:hypothetical protein
MLLERGVGLSSGGWIFVEFLAVRDFWVGSLVEDFDHGHLRVNDPPRDSASVLVQPERGLEPVDPQEELSGHPQETAERRTRGLDPSVIEQQQTPH